MKKIILILAALASADLLAVVVDVTGTGVAKTSVAIQVADPAFAKSLKKNLELTGLFTVVPDGAVKVTGGTGALRAEGAGKYVTSGSSFTDAKTARMAARRFSNLMSQVYGNQKGFAEDRVLFLKRGGARGTGEAIPAELCVSYPDGDDISQLTDDGKMVIFQRWMKDGKTALYISDKNGATQIWQIDTETGRRSVKWSFKGTPTGIAVSPDGTKVAAVLSFQGNPELYVINAVKGNWTRLTKTPYEVEGQPTWSPDGRQIAFVRGDRSQQIWVIDTVTLQERRLTSRGRKNVDPDWGPDGRIAYIAGANIAVMDANGDAGADARTVTEAANWEHPSWSRDGRHLAASRDKAVFVIDTLKDGDRPRQMFYANGNWLSPSWAR